MTSQRLRKRRVSSWSPGWQAYQSGLKKKAAAPKPFYPKSLQRIGWRTYQSKLKWRKTRQQSSRTLFRGGMFMIFLSITVAVIATKSLNSAVKAPKPSKPRLSVIAPVVKESSLIKKSCLISKTEMRSILDESLFINLKSSSLDFDFDGHSFHVQTTIDTSLQNFMLSQMMTRTSRYMGMVVMDPRTGRILSMVSFDRDNSKNNPCTQNLFPAASVFKIVTAAAAMDACGFRPNSTIDYTGRKHTLYKFQLKKHNSYGVSQITLQDSFAQSVNPVFGKIGIHYLGKTRLETYAKSFGFNQPIEFDLPTAPSRISLSDDEYQCAEVASGFNRTTAISPLHGAMIAAATVANNGYLIEPALVEKMSDEYGHVLYRRKANRFNQAMPPRVSKSMKSLMTETIRTGTCRKSFRGYKKDKILSKLIIGGKTGTIGARPNTDRRYDWFVGFAEDKGSNEKIVISIAVAHEKYIGTKANQYARIFIRKYFKTYFEKQSFISQSKNKKISDS